jgi:hypothetical protein
VFFGVLEERSGLGADEGFAGIEVDAACFISHSVGDLA